MEDYASDDDEIIHDGSSPFKYRKMVPIPTNSLKAMGIDPKTIAPDEVKGMQSSMSKKSLRGMNSKDSKTLVADSSRRITLKDHSRSRSKGSFDNNESQMKLISPFSAKKLTIVTEKKRKPGSQRSERKKNKKSFSSSIGLMPDI